ncbi:hypothetical protein NZK35_12235 [Stieleria sp. ICT_E10.1]|uniref:hypothetical protein n=1 Tax=Stieleria sedimenti TaxID=2976331 RepID=UPI0021800CD9|nr:hypothetical protein [Stieleria sedimenti]MCS7467414.1 hypothetical protein [Stieleria sedimenti]
MERRAERVKATKSGLVEMTERIHLNVECKASEGLAQRCEINPSMSPAQTVTLRRQFGIHQLLFCIGFAAVCFAIVNLQVSKRIVSHRSLDLVLEGILVALFAIAVAWTTLTSRAGSLARCGAVLIGLTAAIMLAPQVFWRRGFDLALWQMVLCCNSFLTLIFLVFRVHGYRLTQRPPMRELTGDS